LKVKFLFKFFFCGGFKFVANFEGDFCEEFSLIFLILSLLGVKIFTKHSEKTIHKSEETTIKDGKNKVILIKINQTGKVKKYTQDAQRNILKQLTEDL